VVDFDAASRFKLVETAAQMPGIDFITNSPNGPFVDTGLKVSKFDAMFDPVYGGAHVYLAAATIREMAEGAGLFEPFRDELLRIQQIGYDLGYADAMKENIGGTVSDLATRLGGLADRIAGAVVAEAGPDQVRGDDSDSGVFVTNGEQRSGKPEGTHQGRRIANSADRQSNRASRNKRSDSVPASSGNESIGI
jgi:hypothetical protein